MRTAALGFAACCALHVSLTAAIGGSASESGWLALVVVPVAAAAGFVVRRRAGKGAADADRY